MGKSLSIIFHQIIIASLLTFICSVIGHLTSVIRPLSSVPCNPSSFQISALDSRNRLVNVTFEDAARMYK